MVVIYNQWQLTFNLSDCPFRSALTFFHQTFGPFTDLTEKLAGFQVFRSRAQLVLRLTSIVKKITLFRQQENGLKVYNYTLQTVNHVWETQFVNDVIYNFVHAHTVSKLYCDFFILSSVNNDCNQLQFSPMYIMCSFRLIK